MNPAYLSVLTSDGVVDWKVQAHFVHHGTTTSSWWYGDDAPDSSLRVLEIKQ